MAIWRPVSLQERCPRPLLSFLKEKWLWNDHILFKNGASPDRLVVVVVVVFGAVLAEVALYLGGQLVG